MWEGLLKVTRSAGPNGRYIRWHHQHRSRSFIHDESSRFLSGGAVRRLATCDVTVGCDVTVTARSTSSSTITWFESRWWQFYRRIRSASKTLPIGTYFFAFNKCLTKYFISSWLQMIRTDYWYQAIITWSQSISFNHSICNLENIKKKKVLGDIVMWLWLT